MTTVLGLHFGHDGHVAVLQNGKLAGYVLRERISRRKHDYGLDRQCIDAALKQANVAVREIDFCAVTSTQGCDFPLMEMGDLTLAYATHLPNGRPSPLADRLGGTIDAIERACAPSMIERVLSVPRDPTTHPVFVKYFQQYRKIPKSALKCFPWYEGHVDHPSWKPNSLSFLEEFDASILLEEPETAFGFHLPMRLSIDGIEIPTIRLDHHLAHAASSFYRSPFGNALIITNDGYGGQRSPFANGGVYLGTGRKLYPIWPHRMWMGHLYHVVGMAIGFDALGAPGKLMGLAPYGKPTFFDPRWIGNRIDLERQGLSSTPEGWLADVQNRASLLGLREDDPPERWVPFNRFQLDLAASTQMVFEKQWLALVKAAQGMIQKTGFKIDGLCLSGGAVLNCPSNSRMLLESGLQKIFVEPNCDDGGLAIGAAYWVTHMLLDEKRLSPLGMQPIEAYGGTEPPPNETGKFLADLPSELSFEVPDDPARAAALDLANGQVVGWYEGRSELGPRALGHRSIIALPIDPTMHERVNLIKRRELWRPLAPAVLEGHVEEFFEGPQMNSPYMLFTAQVKRPNELSAICHVDGSARIQTVRPDSGLFHNVLEELFRETGCPVVLNTSMNGPGEPIVETSAQAISFFMSSELDVLYIDGVRIIKAMDHQSVTHP